MNKKLFKKIRGFTLIELLLILAIISILAPTLYRFSRGTVNKGYFHSREAATIRDSRVLFRYLSLDLRHAYGLSDSFRDLNASSNTLIIAAISTEERLRLLSTSGNLAGKSPDKKNTITIVYRLTDLHGIVREIYTGSSGQTSSIVMLGNVDDLEFTFENEKPEASTWVRVSLKRASNINDLWPTGRLYRVFSIGNI